MRRVCLLTGASGLLGHALIDAISDRFSIVGVQHRTSIDRPTQDQFYLDPLAPDAYLAANDQAVLAITADLTRPDEAARVVRETLDEHGQIDLLINAAARRDWASLLAAPTHDHETLLTLNLLAPMWLCAEAARQVWQLNPNDNVEHNRNVVNIASTAGLYVYPDLGQGLYAASKAGLIQLSYHLAAELWDLGIRVNTVAPDTFPGRVSTQDVIDAVLGFEAGNQTGQLLTLVGP